jgi:phosphoglycolate phosphatase
LARKASSVGCTIRRQNKASNAHKVLRQVNAAAPDPAAELELALQRSEKVAAASATPTTGADLVLEACAATDRPVAIVSNNTASAIDTYLDEHELRPLVRAVFGRDPHDVSLMKPDTYLLELALRQLGAERSATVFVGDTVTDMQAGASALIWRVGYANKPGDWGALARAGADSLITDMTEFAAAL